ncbi:MAG: penicillin-binding protein [Ramlibacter sp.]|jgi:CubicO group peptidase (beta-lactamase class C family)|nr:penicillin-binding protein [Ramlibacter sp.]
MSGRTLLTRRTLASAVGALALAPWTERARAQHAPVASDQVADALFRELDERIEAAMVRYHVPGAAVGVYWHGREHLKGFGVTNVDHPLPVDPDTLFRIGSTTKTFTATAMMRLVEQGLVNLAAPARKYLPNLRLADEVVASSVTVRQLLNHSAGWLGDDYGDFGRGEDSIARYVADMKQLPQLTPLGQVFAYNNAAVVVAGRVIETLTSKPYETALQELVLEPLGLRRSGFFTDQLVGEKIAASHDVENDRAVVMTHAWAFPRSIHSTGGLISSAREQLAYARFHLGNGTPDSGKRVLTLQSIKAMRSNPGPCGTITMEIDGVCVGFWQRRTAEGIPVFQHGGSWGGQNSDFFFVPDRHFAMTVLTNSTGGSKLIAELGRSSWALNKFCGLSNPPAEPKLQPLARLKDYEGHYKGWVIPPDGPPDKIDELHAELRAIKGELRATGDLEMSLAFYRDGYVLTTDPDSQVKRSDFLRGPDGTVAWLRDGGRLFAKQG